MNSKATTINAIPKPGNHPIFLMLVSLISFTGNALIIRLLANLEGSNSWAVALARFVVGMAVVGSFYLPKGKAQPRNLITSPLLIIRGLIGGLALLCLYFTIPHLGVGRAVLINSTYPLFAIVFASIFLKEHLRVRQALCFVLAMLGVYLLAGTSSMEGGFTTWDSLAILGAILAGMVVTLIRKLHGTEHSSTIFLSQCTYGIVVVLPPALFFITPISAQALALMLLAGIFAALGQLSMTHAYKHLTVAMGGSMQLSLPVFTTLGGIFLFGEHFTPSDCLGAALILSSCLMIILQKKAR